MADPRSLADTIRTAVEDARRAYPNRDGLAAALAALDALVELAENYRAAYMEQRGMREKSDEAHHREYARAIHTIPVSDLIEHEADPECVCGPELEAVEREDGSFGWLYTHHSLDGREEYE
jgi:hypothetical protein